jgi:hypothetical protein
MRMELTAKGPFEASICSPDRSCDPIRRGSSSARYAAWNGPPISTARVVIPPTGLLTPD